MAVISRNVLFHESCFPSISSISPTAQIPDFSTPFPYSDSIPQAQPTATPTERNANPEETDPARETEESFAEASGMNPEKINLLVHDIQPLSGAILILPTSANTVVGQEQTSHKMG
ncbi:hypothetical protein O181_008245 [Austropuccinia psidii MF-1]|uniref:Uncharacterized protein n=1 Tax=Austropuccinia psidii MF-1 TaxID=1389203 RepID=A0A9Q3BNY8_9BASI|nr:hypothetical protein [Austropuccinia psidii MF-1]